ncbi:MAG: hypothetical protein IPK17_17515 [Chloroflexi bacterium]|uniref:RING finger protein n=1 Tax=Candidatus Flexifilum breve TaxID=3140694 RepID=UPI003136BC53|nr:hypothetical protein [Chloroflexota bacterium]
MARLINQDTRESFALASDKLNYIYNDRGTITVWTDDQKAKKPPQQCAFFRTRRGIWIVLDYTGTQTKVGGLRVADFKIVRENDCVSLNNLKVLFHEIDRFIIEPGSYLLECDDYGRKRKCPYCLASFHVGEEVIICPECSKPHHVECWQTHDNGHCASCDYSRNLGNVSSGGA